ncbi:hypothetical protein ACU635_51160 [[Actinomadura] parvosata]|uniref:hypothetical protein n=1 Tax=[Actinomadura] parvosata TaxID=1955412 RepID=UPI00406C1C78
MHQPHHEPAGVGLTAEQLATTIQQRARRAATAALWANRAAGLVEQLQAENADLRQEVIYYQRWAAATIGLQVNETPPRHYVEALRRAQPEPYRSVDVDVDGEPYSAALSRHPETAPDPLRELACWQALVTAVRATRAALAAKA